MKKVLLCFTVFILFSNLSNLYAQLHTGNFKAVPVKQPRLQSANFGPVTNGVEGACDTVNLNAARNNWQAYYYALPDSTASQGFFFGTSDNAAIGYDTKEDANYFDVSAYDYNYISGGIAYFAFANSNKAANLNKNIVFKVYDDAGGYPGNLLGSASLTLGQIHQDVLNNALTQFKFSSPLKLPLSKTFYVSIDHSNFIWDDRIHDSIAIVANADGDTTGASFQFINVTGSGDGWLDITQFYGVNINLFIFPYVSNSMDGCGVLPVSIFNFGGTIKDDKAYLNWSTAAESNNKGFDIERSKNGKDFTSIGFVNGEGNSSQIKNYSYTDVSLKDINVSTTYYRLKQVDLDGKSSYSKVLALSLQNLVQWKLYPNPVKDVATVELNLQAASKVNAQVISHDGKILVNMDKGILNAGTQQFYINTQSLARGTYLIRLTIADKTYSQLLVKE